MIRHQKFPRVARRRLGRGSFQQDGVILIEVLVSLLLFSLGVLAIVGLQAASVKVVSEAKYRTDASLAANQIIGKMWVDLEKLSTYHNTTENLSQLPNGKRKVMVDGNAVTVTITWRPPELASGDPDRKFETFANIYGGG